MVGLVNGWVNGWVDGWVDEWVDNHVEGSRVWTEIGVIKLGGLVPS